MLIKVKDFLKENPDQRMFSFAWSIYWRLLVLFFGAYVALMVLAVFLGVFLDMVT